MNLRFVVNQLGLLLVVLAGIMLAVAAWDVADWWGGRSAELAAMAALIGAAGIGLLAGGVLWWLGRAHRWDTFGRREALLLVAASWIVGAALAALPMLLWAHIGPAPADHPFRSYVDCYFEAMSGLTTTGATVLADIEAVPRGILLWRALTHWLGGLGIVVLFVAVLPTVGVGGKKIFHLETSGPTQGGVRPRIRDTAQTLWFIYLGLTVVATVALRLCGMGWFDALCHTFAMVSTGGFSPKTASVGGYNAAAVNYTAVVFMVLGGVNFGIYYQLLRGSWRNVWRDPELRFYLAILLGAFVLITGSLILAGEPIHTTDGGKVASDAAGSVEHGLFTTTAISTTTGFVTADFDRWPFLAKAVLVALMFVGGCAGSTAGGIKVVRIWVAIKVMLAEVERIFHPNVVRPMRLGRTTVDTPMRLSIMVYVFGIVVLFTAGALAVKLIEGEAASFTTAATASLASLCTIGPGLAQVGAVENYGWMTGPTKGVLCLLMALGRLEVFAIFVLFVPRFWASD